MSKLKAVHAFDVYEAYTKTGDDDAAQVYLKFEADKVIADLEESHKKEVGQLLIEIVKLKEHVKSLILDNYLKDKEIRRLKYKRCLAMAEACIHKRWRTDDWFDYARSTRHMNKWLAIAEKFKTNSTAQ